MAEPAGNARPDRPASVRACHCGRAIHIYDEPGMEGFTRGLCLECSTVRCDVEPGVCEPSPSTLTVEQAVAMDRAGTMPYTLVREDRPMVEAAALCAVAEAAEVLLSVTGHVCRVCLGVSPLSDGHDKNPPCEIAARDALREAVGVLRAVR